MGTPNALLQLRITVDLCKALEAHADAVGLSLQAKVRSILSDYVVNNAPPKIQAPKRTYKKKPQQTQQPQQEEIQHA